MDFCTCNRGTCDPSVIAIASVPVQKWEEPYGDDRALALGTLFPSLNLPFFKTDDRKGGVGDGC